MSQRFTNFTHRSFWNKLIKYGPKLTYVGTPSPSDNQLLVLLPTFTDCFLPWMQLAMKVQLSLFRPWARSLLITSLYGKHPSYFVASPSAGPQSPLQKLLTDMLTHWLDYNLSVIVDCRHLMISTRLGTISFPIAFFSIKFLSSM